MSGIIQIPLSPPAFDGITEWGRYIRDLQQVSLNDDRKAQSYELYKYLNVDYHNELHNLGRLKRNETQIDPAFVAVNRNAYYQHQDQWNHAGGVDEHDKIRKNVVIEIQEGKKDHQGAA